jgi:hypothetical protein
MANARSPKVVLDLMDGKLSNKLSAALRLYDNVSYNPDNSPSEENIS